MKKTFPLTAVNKKPERVVESVKKDAKKYIARERRKELPKNVDFWDFDCRIGQNEQEAKAITVAEINKNITEIAASGAESLYLEILTKKGIREKSPKA